MWKATAAFVHPGDVQVPVNIVAGDLHIANEGREVGHRYLAAPSDAVVSGAAYDQGALTDVKVVPGNVHVSEVRRGGVIVSPARFPVVAAGGVNAKMSSPASRVQRISGLEPAQGAAPVAVEPDREPGAGWFVVQNNGVAKGVVKGASTGGGGDAGEGGPAVRGARYAGEVAKVGASRIVEGDANLVGIIGVRRGVCLRLRCVGERLSAGDQVDVRGTIRQGCPGRWQQFLDKLGEARWKVYLRVPRRS